MRKICTEDRKGLPREIVALPYVVSWSLEEEIHRTEDTEVFGIG
jgi:hypothetical protein